MAGPHPFNCPEHPRPPVPREAARTDIYECAKEIYRAHKAGASMRGLAAQYECAYGTIRRVIKAQKEAAEKAAEPRSGVPEGDRVREKAG